MENTAIQRSQVIYLMFSFSLKLHTRIYFFFTPRLLLSFKLEGHVGWGISWYINGLLIPEINVVRGKKYTFVVEGGLDPETPARYHPFYITDDPIGGYQHKTPEEKAVSI